MLIINTTPWIKEHVSYWLIIKYFSKYHITMRLYQNYLYETLFDFYTYTDVHL